MHWLHTPSYMGFVDESKSLLKYEVWPTGMTKSGWDKTMLSWEDEMLPFVDIPLSMECTLEEYILYHTKNSKKVAGMFPETYICDSATVQEVADLIGQQNAFLSVRLVSSKKGSAVRYKNYSFIVRFLAGWKCARGYVFPVLKIPNCISLLRGFGDMCL